MRILKIHRDASDDLEAIRQHSPAVAREIGAFLEQAKLSQSLLDTFTDDLYGDNHRQPHKVRQWQEQQKLGRNLWALNIWSLEDARHIYRLIYAFGPPYAHYVLAVARHETTHHPEDFDYQGDHAITRRVVALYDRLKAAGRL